MITIYSSGHGCWRTKSSTNASIASTSGAWPCFQRRVLAAAIASSPGSRCRPRQDEAMQHVAVAELRYVTLRGYQEGQWIECANSGCLARREGTGDLRRHFGGVDHCLAPVATDDADGEERLMCMVAGIAILSEL